MSMRDLKRVRRAHAAAIAGAALAILAATAPIAAAASPIKYNRPSAMHPEGDPVKGKVLAAQCLSCHGVEAGAITFGKPSFHPPRLRYQRISSMFYALQDYRGGRRKSDVMGPLAKTLSDQDMRDLAAYITAGPNRHVGASPGGPQMAKSWAHEKVTEVCGFCHGESGLGELEGYPVIAGQHKDYLEHALSAYRSGERSNPIMRTFAKRLKPDELKQLAAYFAAQPGLEPVQ